MLENFEKISKYLLLSIFFDQFIELRFDIIEIYLSKKSNIKYNSTIYKNLDKLSILYIEYCISTITIISFKHKNKFLIVFNKFDFYLLFVRIISKRKYVQRINMFFLTKFYNNKIDRNFLKYLIVVIQILTFYFIVF